MTSIDRVLVVDFDGTLTTSDVGDDLCQRFAPPAWRDVDAAWVRGELSLPEAQRRMWSLVRAGRAEVDHATREIGRLRDGIDRLLDGAVARGFTPWLASGGFDFYIEALLGERLSRFDRVWFNRMRFEGDRLLPEFPHLDAGCGRCAVCKGRICDLARARGASRVVFAGDGHSDRCALGRADAVAAVRGSSLVEHARRHGFVVAEFDRLDDLLPLLEGVTPR